MPPHVTPDTSSLVGYVCHILPLICCVDDGVSSHWQLCGTPLKLRCVARVASLTRYLPSALVLFVSCLHGRTLLLPLQVFSDSFQKTRPPQPATHRFQSEVTMPSSGTHFCSSYFEHSSSSMCYRYFWACLTSRLERQENAEEETWAPSVPQHLICEAGTSVNELMSTA